MTKNLKKALSLIRSGQPVTEDRFPVNAERAMTKVYGKEWFSRSLEVAKALVKAEMTEAEFHQEHSVEKVES